MRRVILSTLFLVLAVAAVLALVWTQQRRMIYFPFAEVPPPAAVGLANVEAVTFTTADALVLHGWFVPAAGPPPHATVLVFNGNAGNRAYRAPLAAALQAQGIHVFLIDYRGYGGNPGVPTERGLAADSRAARCWLLTRSGVDPARFVYFGESLGASVALELAVTHPPAALILRSPFTSLAEVGRHHYPFLPVRLLLRDRFDSMERIARLRSPLLVIAGTADGIVPAAHSRRLYDAAAEPKRLVMIPGADHNDDTLLAGEEMIRAVVALIREVT